MSFSNEDILTLAKAGFSATQIAALSQVQSYPQNPQPQPQLQQQATIQPTQQMPTQVTQAPAAQATQQSTAAAQVSAPAAEPQGSSTDEILKAINGLSSTFQQTMLQTAVQPQPKTAEDILAEIINPPSKAQGGKQ